MPHSNLPRVLAADGDLAVRRFYGDAFPRLGYQVCLAEVGLNDNRKGGEKGR